MRKLPPTATRLPELLLWIYSFSHWQLNIITIQQKLCFDLLIELPSWTNWKLLNGLATLSLMAEENKKSLQSRLCDIANTLRGKMGANEFRDYILGFIFYKYLSERMHLFADDILKHDGIKFDDIDENSPDAQEILDAIKQSSNDEVIEELPDESGDLLESLMNDKIDERLESSKRPK